MFSRRIRPSRAASGWRFLSFVTVVALLPGMGIAANFTMGPAVDYTEGDPAVTVLPQFTLQDASQNYAGKNITFSLDGTYDPGELLSIPDTEGDPSTVNGAMSVKNGTIFKGNGTTAAAVGNIDGTLNGQAKNLKINFTNAFTNGDFSQEATGWTISNTRTFMGYSLADGTPVTTGVTQIGGWPAPVDYLWGPGNTPTTQNSTIRRDRATSTNTFSTTTSGNLTMNVGNGSCPSQGFCVVRGPHVISESSVYLAAGDGVSFTWAANAGQDSYDVFGYLLNTENGKTIRLIDETGVLGQTADGTIRFTLGSARDMTGYISVGSSQRNNLVNYKSGTPVVGASQYDDLNFIEGGSVTPGNYRFVFIAGSYDDNGGTALGATFTIDNISVSSSSPATVNAADIQALVRMLKYSNTNATTRARTLTYASSIPDTGLATTINVTAVNDSPVLANVAAQTITDTPATDSFSNVTGTLSATDEESDPIVYGLSGASVSGTTASLTNALGSMSVDTGTGAFVFTPNAAAINALSANTSVTFTFTASDGTTTSTKAFTLNFVGVQESLPGAPVIDTVTAGDSKLIINFTAPVDGGSSPITNYKYSTDGTTYLALNPASDVSPIEITTASDGVTPLANGTVYNITIKAVNGSGDSPASNSVAGTPAARPAPAVAPSPTPSPTPRPTRSPAAPPRPSPSPAPSVAAPVATPTPTPSPTATGPVAEQVRIAEQTLVNPVRPAPTVEQFLAANPEVGSVTELGFVAVNPTQSLAVRDGVPETVELFPNEAMTGYVVQGDDFRLALAATTEDGTPIEMDSSGNIILSPSQGAQVEGIGFAPGTRVVVWMFSEPMKLGELTTNAQGSFEGTVPIPSDLEVGQHTIQINGVTSAGETRSVSLGVVVQDQAPIAALPSFDGVLTLMWSMVALLILIAITIWFIAWRRRRQNQSQPSFA